jgi:pyruvate,water dikinase
VDRLSDDYPVLVSPGQPNLRVNASPEDTWRYSPRFIDAINLESENLESIPIDTFLADIANEYPELEKIFSVYRDNQIREIRMTGIDAGNEAPVVTFNSLIARTPFIAQIQAVLRTLEDTLHYPVDIEFASDGLSLHLLQCRPQSHSRQRLAALIPSNIPSERVLFNARRFVCNGQLSGINYIVYVDPQGYGDLTERAEMLEVGRAVSKLNEILPRRQFILMGPGRWGSRGDIKLGVSVDYAGINNSAMLIEIARKKGSYVPELSFGTHFFQDLVEADIHYLPLYPDDSEIVFNESFLLNSPNRLAEFLPEYARLSGIVHVIEVPQAAEGMTLSVAMNSESGVALAYFDKSKPGASTTT